MTVLTVALMLQCSVVCRLSVTLRAVICNWPSCVKNLAIRPICKNVALYLYSDETLTLIKYTR